MTFAQKARLFGRMVALNLQTTLAYRGDFVFYMLGIIFTPLLSALVWRAALASGAELPVDRSYLMTYFVFLAIVSMLSSSWLSGFMVDTIRDGQLSKWLVRPGSMLYEMAANNISEKLVKSVVLFPMVALFALAFRHDVSVNSAAWRWLVAVVAVVLAAVLSFAFDVAEGSLGFWLEELGGIIKARALVMSILAGQLIPLALFPDWAQGFMKIQPFRYFISFPLEVVLGSLSAREIAFGLAVQTGYAALFVLLARWLWASGKRSYSAVGA